MRGCHVTHVILGNTCLRDGDQLILVRIRNDLRLHHQIWRQGRHGWDRLKMAVLLLVFIPDLHHDLSWQVNTLIGYLMNKVAEITSRAPCRTMKQSARDCPEILRFRLLQGSDPRWLQVWLRSKYLCICAI